MQAATFLSFHLNLKGGGEVEEEEEKMCSSSSGAFKTSPCFSGDIKKKMRLEKRLRKKAHRDLQLVNLKLYLENRSIMEDNKRLRKKALQLNQENRALLSHLGVTNLIVPPPPSLPY